MQTKGKTGLIALLFLALIELAILGFLLDEVPTVGGDPDATSSCSDGVQSGAEEGTDCGLVACGIACAPTEVLALD